jgi:hypothetical protein
MKFSIGIAACAALFVFLASSAMAEPFNPSDDVKSCLGVVALMEEAEWKESAEDLAKALGVTPDFVRGCLAAHTHHVALEKADPPVPDCGAIIVAVEEAGGAKSTDEIAADLKVTPERVRDCQSKPLDND